MNPDDFKNLALIPNMLKQIEEMSNALKKLMPPITSKKEVAKFLGRSESTINSYITQGLLVEGRHFSRKNGKMLVFVESAVIEFRKELLTGTAHAKVTI